MKLNPLLVPFKLAVTIESSSDKFRIKLYEIADYLIDLFKEHPEMNIFPFVQDNLITIQQLV